MVAESGMCDRGVWCGVCGEGEVREGWIAFVKGTHSMDRSGDGRRSTVRIQGMAGAMGWVGAIGLRAKLWEFTVDGIYSAICVSTVVRSEEKTKAATC